MRKHSKGLVEDMFRMDQATVGLGHGRSSWQEVHGQGKLFTSRESRIRERKGRCPILSFKGMPSNLISSC